MTSPSTTAPSNTTTTSNETEGAGSEESSFQDNPPPRRKPLNPRRGSLLRSSGNDWRQNALLPYSTRALETTHGSSRRLAAIDDEEGKAQFFLSLLFDSIEDSAALFAGTILSLVVWAILCSFGVYELRARAAADPGGVAEQWLEDIEACRNAVSIIGTLFVFTLVFRFNACYDRWWESRIFWGDIVSKCLELGMMNRRWFDDEDLQDKLSRFIVVFSYACKSLLRGHSLKEDGQDGQALVKRGLLTQQELDLMHSCPSWQPHFCLDVIREVIVQLHMIPGGKGLRLDDANKIHGQLFRCLDNTLKDMNQLIGNCIRVRASGLPASYDAITMTSFVTFFVLASVVWSAAIGWMTPIVVFLASMIIMFLIVMGTKLVDPFGLDKVDIPMEDFCATIEAQMHAIDERAGSVVELSSKTVRVGNRIVRRGSGATFHIPKWD